MNKEQIINLAIEKGFTYNPMTGNIYGVKGKLITSRNAEGYIFPGVLLEKKFYKFLGHTFAWYVTYNKMPDNQIDHINGVRDDNRISNLRDVTIQHNQWNQTKAKGCSWHKRDKKWKSQIGVDGKQIHLGYFDTEIEARQAYLDAKKQHHSIDFIYFPI
jgi:hypothetical protein